MVDVKCPSCGSTKPPVFNPDSGEYICPDCGYIYGPVWEPFIPRSKDEYRMKVHSEKMSRNPDTTPKSLIKKYPLGRRLLKQDEARVVRYDMYLSSVQRTYNVPEYVIEEVRKLFQKLQEGRVLKGRSHKLVIATLLYVVSKKYPNVKVTRETLEKISESDITRIYRFYRFLVREGYIDSPKPSTPRKPGHYLPEITSRIEQELKSSPEKGKVLTFFHRIPQNLLLKASEEFSKYLQGTKPNGLAAATIYFFLRVTGIRLNQDVIANIAEVSPLTVRRIIKEITKSTDIVLKI
ncbi:TFIIB-type zinc ribbon-containing protein [Infirmifilum uzonense]|uniref:TFIIB-type zinc ribbon-containing protein n=1 Tax=Infirmifilum uzonense TaxID=1550241 RepID=UPI003C72BDD7